MSDLIDRDEAIDMIEKYFDGLPIAVHHDMLAMIHRLPSAQPQKICVAEIQVEIDDIKDYIDKAIEEIKTGEWLHEILQDAIDANEITETQAIGIMWRAQHKGAKD